MNVSATDTPQTQPRVRLVKSGSVQVRIFESLHRGKPYFSVYWRIAGGALRRNFSDLKAAQKFAKDKAEALASGQVGETGISATEAQTYREAIRRLGPLDIPLHVAAAEYASAMEKLNGTGTLQQAVEFFIRNTTRPEMNRTVAEVLTEFVEVKKLDGVSTRYVEDLENRLGRFAEDFQMPISHVHTREIGDWLRKLRSGPRTRNNFRTLIVTLFQFARKQGYWSIDRPNPALQVDRAKVRGAGAISIFSPGELSEMLAVARGPQRLAIALGAFAGIRQAEILRLRWENFNWEEQVIDLGSDQTKTASRRLAPILPALTAWITPLTQKRGVLFPFNEDSGFHRIFGSVIAEVNAARPEGERDFKWQHNGLRHSYASYRLASIDDVAKVSLEMGNSPQKVFTNYRKVVTKSQAAAWFGVLPEMPVNVVPISPAC